MTEIVALYARVSTEDQKEKQTIEAQIAYAREVAGREGWTFVAFKDDGVSGMRPFAERPGGAALMSAVRGGQFRKVVSYSMNRFGRDDLETRLAVRDIERLGAEYRSLTEHYERGTPSGDFQMAVGSAVAQLDRANLLQRMREGKRRVATYDDRWIAGVVPYGYVRVEDHRLVVEPQEAEVVRQIYAWCIAGWSHGRIAEELSRRGVPTHSDAPGKRTQLLDKRGRRSKALTWERPAISRILRSELYTGRASFFKGSKTTELTHRSMPRIIDAATFLRAREATAQQRQFGGTHKSEKHEYRLRGLVKCGRCGHTITGRQWRTAHGYYCHYCPAGEKAFVPEETILSVLWRDVLDFLSHPDQTLRALARAATEAGMTEDRAEQELMVLAQRARELDFQESQLVDMRLSRTITPSIYDQKFKALAAARQHLGLQQQAVRDERAAAARATTETEAARRLLGSLRSIAEENGSDPTIRAEIVKTVTKSVVVHVTSKRPRLHVTYAFGRPVSIPEAAVCTDGTNLS